MKQPTLKGKLVTLRPLKISDAKTLIGLLKDKRISKYLKRSLFPPPSLASEKKWVRKTWKLAKDGTDLSWVIIYNEDKSLAGVISFHKITISKSKKSAETGTWLAVKYWGRGLNSEAKKLMIDFAFKKIKLEKVMVECKTTNIRSKKAIEKLGAKYEGTKRHEIYKDGKWHDLYSYSILKNEWLRR